MDLKPLHGRVTGHVVFTDDLLTFNSTDATRENISLDTPLFHLQFNLPLPSGHWPIVLEGFHDGSWIAYFEEDQRIISGSNDNWKETLHDLVVNSVDELQTIREYGDNITPYLKNRRNFLEKIFGYESQRTP